VHFFDWIQAWFSRAATQIVVMPIYWAAPMMALIAIADSSLLSLPEVNDIITVTRIAHNPHEVYYFPLFPAVGSLIGCLILYRIARQGRKFLTSKFDSKLLARVEDLYRRWGLFALAIPALLPPPLPFKVFVATAGALGYPLKKFILTVLIARLIRYYSFGIAAYFFREEVLQAIEWSKEHFPEILIALLILLTVGALINWWLRSRNEKAKLVSSSSD
jgi:membrane protein DedA with SNARE-associated domain